MSWPDCAVPALILRGQRGEIRQETAERMLAVIPQARAQTIYGSSHDVFLGPGSEQTLAAIQLFLFGLDGGKLTARSLETKASASVWTGARQASPSPRLNDMRS